MRQDLALQWAEELESGRYQQGQEWLTSIVDGRERDCCLGVLCKMAQKAGVLTFTPVRDTGSDGFRDIEYLRYAPQPAPSYRGVSYLPQEVQDWAGLRTRDGQLHGVEDFGRSLTFMNDEGRGFSDIAATIRERWEDL